MNETATLESSPRPGRSGVIWCAVVALVLNGPALIRRDRLNIDETTIAVVARVMRHGGSLYVDAVDRKPPAAFVISRLLQPLFGSWSLAAFRWLMVIGVVAAMWVLAGEAVRRWPTVSRTGVAILGIVACALLPAEDSRAVGFEMLGLLPMIAAFVLGARGRFLAAGACLGVAGLCKQPLLLGAVPLAWQVFTARHLTSPVARLRQLMMAGAVSVATLVAGLAPFGLANALKWYSGAGDPYLEGTTWGTVVRVTALGWQGAIGSLGGIVVLALVAWNGPTWRNWRRPPADVLVWLGAGLAATAIGLRFIQHYFVQAIPALVLLAAPAVTWATPRAAVAALRRHLVIALAAAWLLISAVVSYVTVIDPTLVHDLPDVSAVSAAVHDMTVPGDRIFVWGQASEIYWDSGRDPATRYPHLQFITGITPKRPGLPAYVLTQPDAIEHLLDDLAAHPPVVIVDAAIERVRGGDRYPLATSPIAALVASDYCVASVVGDITLYTRC